MQSEMENNWNINEYTNAEQYISQVKEHSTYLHNSVSYDAFKRFAYSIELHVLSISELCDDDLYDTERCMDYDVDKEQYIGILSRLNTIKNTLAIITPFISELSDMFNNNN